MFLQEDVFSLCFGLCSLSYGKLNYEVVLVLCMLYAPVSILCAHSLREAEAGCRSMIQDFEYGICSNAEHSVPGRISYGHHRIRYCDFHRRPSLHYFPGIQGTVVGICDLEAGSVHFKKHAEIQYSDDPDNDLLRVTSVSTGI